MPYSGKDLDSHEGSLKKIRKSPFMSSALFCGQCHGQGPNLEFTPPVQCATLYGSYLHGYIANGGSRTCQDCHMKGNDHSVPPNFNNKKETSQRLREALPMDVEILPYTFQAEYNKPFPVVVVRVSIENKAGHRIPDG